MRFVCANVDVKVMVNTKRAGNWRALEERGISDVLSGNNGNDVQCSSTEVKR
jgi:hypothetical protein